MNQQIIKLASSYIGVQEIEGPEHNQTIVNWAHDIGLTWINDDETPNCAIFINYVLKQCGYRYLKSARARDFEKYGQVTTDPQAGDIVVFFRGKPESGKGHVGVFLGYDRYGKIFVLGANQRNSVRVDRYPTDKVTCFVRVSESDGMDIPDVRLERGSKGKEVTDLQTILKFFDFYKIAIDDDFGPGTAEAVMAFQIKHGLPRTGIYDSVMRDKIFTLLNA